LGVRESKPAPPPIPEDPLERLRLKTEAIVSKSRKLINELEELLETGRQLRAAQAALIEDRRKHKARK